MPALTHPRGQSGATPAGLAGPLPGGQGTLLAVVPADDGRSRLAIVGYLIAGPAPGAEPDGSPPVAGPSSAGGPSAGGTAVERPAAGPPPVMLVDRAQHQVFVGGRDAGLVFQEYQLLEFLIANPHRAFTRRQLLARAWGRGDLATTRTVDVHVHRIRRKLGPGCGRYLVTVRRVGYMFRPPAPGAVVSAGSEPGALAAWPPDIPRFPTRAPR